MVMMTAWTPITSTPSGFYQRAILEILVTYYQTIIKKLLKYEYNSFKCFDYKIKLKRAKHFLKGQIEAMLE